MLRDNAPSFAEDAAEMPFLASEALAAPNIVNMGWRPHQKFSAKADPDRTRMPWVVPDFTDRVDPQSQTAKTILTELNVPDSQKRSCRFARVIRHVVAEEDCASLIAAVNGKGFTPALLNVGGGMQMLAPEARDGHRVIVDSQDLADWLLEVLRPYLPETLPDGSHLVGLNERLRFLCYTPGQEFPEHNDGRYIRPHRSEDEEVDPRGGDFSAVTVQLYLHDVPDQFGGATTFYPNATCRIKHQPEVGSVLLFTQDLPHEGSKVIRGIKYTVRTEAMFRRCKN